MFTFPICNFASVGVAFAGLDSFLYDNKSYDPAEATALNATHFSADGSKMYIISQNEYVYQYTLSTPWDVSTATYDTKSFLTSAEVGNLFGGFIGYDGTKFYALDWTNDKIIQYTMSTPWDISTCSYDSKFFLYTSQASSMEGMFMSQDGTKMYLSSYSTDHIYQYTLSTAWDISTVSYDSKSLYVNSQDSKPYGIAITDDGRTLLMGGNTTGNVFQYTMSTPWDISTASYDSIFLYSGSIDGYDMEISPDGTKLYLLDNKNYNHLIQFNLGIAWDITSGVYHDTFSSGPPNVVLPRGLYWKNDGTKFFTIDDWSSAYKVHQGNCSTAWDISTASWDSKTYNYSAIQTDARDVEFSSDGTKMYIIDGYTTVTVYQYTLSTAWDVSTASYASKNKNVSAQEGTPESVNFSSDGTKMYVAGRVSKTIYQYTLSTAWDVSTASYASKSLSVSSEATTPINVHFKADGTKVWVLNWASSNAQNIFQYSLSTAWDISTGSYDSIFWKPGVIGATADIALSADQTKVYVSDSQNGDKVHQYSSSV